MKKYIIKVNGASYEVEVEEVAGAANAQTAPALAQSTLAQASVAAPIPMQATAATAAAPRAAVAAPVAAAATPGPAPAAAPAVAPAGATSITAPMPGTVVRVVVNVGDTVKRAQTVVLLESMKMETEIVSTCDGKVLAINTTQGATVNTGDTLVSIG